MKSKVDIEDAVRDWACKEAKWSKDMGLTVRETRKGIKIALIQTLKNMAIQEVDKVYEL